MDLRQTPVRWPHSHRRHQKARCRRLRKRTYRVRCYAHSAPPPADEPAQPEPPKEETTGLSEEEAALQQYWKDYVAWEKSFVDYHGRKPTKEEGAQDVPPEHQRG